MMRWITGIPLAVLVVVLLMFAPIVVPKFIILFLAVIGCWEFLSMTLGRTSSWDRIIGCQFVAIGVGIFIFLKTSFAEEMFLFSLFVAAFLIQLQHDGETTDRVRRAAFFFVGVFYCTFFFSFIARILSLPRHHFWIFLLLAATFLADTMAYLIGKRWGKHKLAPKISPAKSVEGLLGGLVGGIIAAWAVKLIFWPTFSPGLITCLGFGIALVGLLGDLSESLIKRGFGVKDSGGILPGHGGILDRLDAVLFNAPWVYGFATLYFNAP